MTMQDVIVWFRGEIERLEKSPSRECIETNIKELRAELTRLEAEYPSTPQPNPEDAATTL